MTRWALHQVRHGLYAPLELLHDLGLPTPRWVIHAIVAIDKPILRALMPDLPRSNGVSGS